MNPSGGRTVAMLAASVGRQGEVGRLARLVQRLASRGIECRVFCLDGGPALLERHVAAVECPWMTRRWLNTMACRELIASDRGFRPSIVHALHADVLPAGDRLAEGWRAPLIATCDDARRIEASHRHHWRRCRAVVVDDPAIRDRVASSGVEPADIPRGLEAPAAGPNQSGGSTGRLPVIGASGRWFDSCGFEVFLDAIHRLVEAGRDVEALVAWPRAGESVARVRAERLGIADRLTFAGPSSLEGTFWDVIDLYCQPSDRPSSSLGTAMAMTCGIPCVVSDVPAHRLAAVEGGGPRGLFFRPGATGSLVEAISEVLDHPSRAAEMALHGRHWAARNHDPDREADRLASLYRSVGDARPAPTPESAAAPAATRRS